MFPGFQGGCNGWGGGCGGFGGGFGFGGPCNRCGHCCYCNRNSNLTMIAIAAMCCRDGRRDFWDGGFFRGIGGGFPGAGHLGREEKKERVCEDVRTRPGSYIW